MVSLASGVCAQLLLVRCPCRKLSVWLQARAVQELSEQLESTRFSIEQTQRAVSELRVVVDASSDESDARLELKDTERRLAALLRERDALKTKLRAARPRAEEAEHRFAKEQSKLEQFASSAAAVAPCPVCRALLTWDPAMEAAYTTWCARACAPASASPDDADMKAAFDSLDERTRAYVDRFRQHVAEVTEAQKAAGGQIDPAPAVLIVGAAAPTQSEQIVVDP